MSTNSRYSTVQYSTVQYSTVQYSTVQYSPVQYSAVQCSTVQYSTVQLSLQTPGQPRHQRRPLQPRLRDPALDGHQHHRPQGGQGGARSAGHLAASTNVHLQYLGFTNGDRASSIDYGANCVLLRTAAPNLRNSYSQVKFKVPTYDNRDRGYVTKNFADYTPACEHAACQCQQ